MVIASTILRALGRSVIPKLFTAGYSATRGLEALKAMGYGYRKKRYLADWREITGAKKLERVYKFIPKKYALSYALMAPAEVAQRCLFKYIFNAFGVDLNTREPVASTVSMGREERISPEQAETEMMEALEDEKDWYEDAYGWEISHVELKVVYRRVT